MLEASTAFYPLSVGELVGGKYRISSILGEGGMGIVFAAKHVDLNCDVAIKVIRQELNQQPELIARLMLEARAAAQIRSEHVCRVLDVARLDTGAPYVVMEYLDGKNLASVLDAKGRLPERLAVRLLTAGLRSDCRSASGGCRAQGSEARESVPCRVPRRQKGHQSSRFRDLKSYRCLG